MVKTNRKQKIYGLVMIGAIAAFGIDRMYSGPPGAEASNAVPVAESPAPAPEAVAAPPDKTPVPSLRVSLDAMLASDKLDPESVSDAFSTQRTWTAKPQLAADPRSDINGTDDFRKAHTLSATMQTPNGSVAIVNDKVLNVGDVMDGYTLVSVSHRTAVLRSAVGEVELTMGAASDNIRILPKH